MCGCGANQAACATQYRVRNYFTSCSLKCSLYWETLSRKNYESLYSESFLEKFSLRCRWINCYIEQVWTKVKFSRQLVVFTRRTIFYWNTFNSFEDDTSGQKDGHDSPHVGSDPAKNALQMANDWHSVVTYARALKWQWKVCWVGIAVSFIAYLWIAISPDAYWSFVMFSVLL